MKKIKFIIIFFLLIFFFLFKGENYQKYLETFTDGIYYFNSVSNQNERHYDILKLAEDNDCQVFCVVKESKNMLSNLITVYATPKTINYITEKCEFDSGVYKSLFSGSTEIVFKDFLLTPTTDTNYYFFGNENDVWNIRNSYGGSAVHKNNFANEKLEQNILYLTFTIFFLILTGLDIKLQQKEKFLSVVFGKSIGNAIIKNILIDTIYFLFTHAVLYLFLNKYTHLNYQYKEILLILVLFLIINSLLYLFMFRFEHQKSITKTLSFSYSTLSNCYVVKAIILIITIIVLTSNIYLILENGNTLIQYNKLYDYEDYYFVDIYNKTGATSEEEAENQEEKLNYIRKSILYDMYKEDRVAFSVLGLTSHECNFLIMNRHAKNIWDNIPELNKVDWSKDYYILIPSNLDSPDAVSLACDTFGIYFREVSDNANYEVLRYKNHHNLLYFKNETDKITAGFDTFTNPVIILCNISSELINNVLKSEDSNMSCLDFHNMMFKITDADLHNWEIKYSISKENLQILTTNAIEKVVYCKSAVERTLLLNTVISLLLLFLEALILITTVKLEYTANAMDISLKKILGYSLFHRNKTAFFLNIFSVFIAISTTFILSLMTRTSYWYISIFLGLIIVFFEFIFIGYYALKLDRINIPKILKGGYL